MEIDHPQLPDHNSLPAHHLMFVGETQTVEMQGLLQRDPSRVGSRCGDMWRTEHAFICFLASSSRSSEHNSRPEKCSIVSISTQFPLPYSPLLVDVRQLEPPCDIVKPPSTFTPADVASDIRFSAGANRALGREIRCMANIPMPDDEQQQHGRHSSLNDLARAASLSEPEPVANVTRCSTCRRRKVITDQACCITWCGSDSNNSLQVKCSGAPAPCSSCHRLGLECTFHAFTQDTSGQSAQLLMPTESRTEAGIARRRTIAACNLCKTRKVKCSGHRPRCKGCESRRLECVYGQAQREQTQTSPERAGEYDNGLVASSMAPSTPGHSEQTNDNSSPLLLHVDTEKRLLSRDVLTQHIRAYFVHVYHLPGYDFLHRPSVLESLHNDTLPPILSTALCAAVSMYISPRDVRQISIQWARDVDGYIFSHLNQLKLLNLQIMVLSMFQHFVYRQFGRVWLMLGMASRLALGLELNRDADPTSSNVPDRECRKRLAWSLFIHDKMHSGGIDEFVTMPEPWMHLSLPISETDFHHERDCQTGTLSDDFETLPHQKLGLNGYMVVLQNLRHHILGTTKAVIANRRCPPSEIEKTLTPLVELKAHMESFYAKLPAHLTLSDRAVFSHSSTPEFTAYMSLHTWYFQGSCDLYRVCLPGVLRESAPTSFLANAPGQFVVLWQRLAVSFAYKMAVTWRRLIEMKANGTLSLPGGFPPLSPDACVSIHQCTKILLTAKTYQIYSGLLDPISSEPVTLGDEAVDALCQSNLAYLEDLALIAPIAAVVQCDVKDMIEAHRRGSPNSIAQTAQAPVSSQIQQEKILSRYNVLAMSIAASNDEAVGSGESTQSRLRTPGSTFLSHVLNGVPETVQTDPHPYQNIQQPQRQDAYVGPAHQNLAMNDFGQGSWDGPGIGLAGEGLGFDYSVATSRYDMDGELDWFLMNVPLERPPGPSY